MKISKKAQQETGIALTAARLQPLRQSVIAPAVILPNERLEALVGSLVSGRIEKVFVHEGESVKQGQLLCLVQSLEVQTIKADYLKARAQYTLAKAALERQKKLTAENISSGRAQIEAEADYQRGAADFTGMSEKIRALGLSGEDLAAAITTGAGTTARSSALPIRSPIAGMVAMHNGIVGERVDINTDLYHIVGMSSLWVEAQVPARAGNGIRVGDLVTIKVDELSGETVEGKVVSIASVLNEQTKTVAVRVEVMNRDNRLKPQMFATAVFNTGGDKGSDVPSITVPSDAVLRETLVQDGREIESYFVFVATSDTTFEKRLVELEALGAVVSGLRSGVREGERVVSKGVFYLRSESQKAELQAE